MNFSEYPQEIKDLVKLRTEEAGNIYQEITFDTNKTSGSTDDGFSWMDTPEGFDFWYDIMECGDIDVFYKFYPK